MELEQKGKGLNLSLQVLDGILAHDGEMLNKEYKPNYGKTWTIFEEEYGRCFSEENYSKKIFPMTLEGCVVRIADVIAYIGRDIEDAITLRVITRKAIPPEIKRTLGSSNDKIINNLVLNLIRNSYDKNHLAFSGDIFKALSDLKEFNKENIYFNPHTNTEIDKIENMFEQLFWRYCRDLENNSQDSYIHNFIYDMDDVYLQNTDDKRMVIDCIAGMTDDFFYNQYQELFVPQSYGYQLKSS